MTWGGWIVMVFSVGGSTAFLAWCVYRVIRKPQADTRLHSTMETPPDARDSEDTSGS